MNVMHDVSNELKLILPKFLKDTMLSFFVILLSIAHLV